MEMEPIMTNHWRAVFCLFLAASLVAGCNSSGGSDAPQTHSAPTQQQVDAGGGAGVNTPPKKTGMVSNKAIPIKVNSNGISYQALEANASALGVNIASWKTETPKGSFASLRVPNEGSDEPLSIESLSVSVTIEGRMARTEVTQVFRNHLSRQTQGTYEFTLPANAAISKLAMDVEGKMMEGELVERERARLIYEGIVNRKKDPALLEWQGGERFQTQIFPIPANGTKTVALTYEVMLPESRQGLTYQYSLPNLEGKTGSEIGAFDFRLDAVTDRPLELRGYQGASVKNPKSTHISFDRKAFLPTGPIEVAFGLDANKDDDVRHGARKVDGELQQFFVIGHTPELKEAATKHHQNIVVAIDTSAGLGDAVVDQSKIAGLMMVDSLGEGAQFNIVHGDYRAHTCSTQPLTRAGRAVAVDCLKGLDAGGASDLGALLDHATRAAAEMDGPTAVVLFSDGVASLGELDGELIKTQVTSALIDKKIRLHTVAVGHGPAEVELQAMARATKGHDIRMTPGELPHHAATRLNDRMSEPLLTNVSVKILDGTVSYLTPSTPKNITRGEAITILGRLDSPSAKIELTGDYFGASITKTFEVKAQQPEESTLLANFWARAAIDAMEAEGLHRREISAHSLRYGVMSKYTSFLVLENEEAYKRFQIERRKEAQRQVAETQEKSAGNLKKGKGDLQEFMKNAEKKKDARRSSADQLSALQNLGLSANADGELGGLKGFNAASDGSRAYAISESGSGVGGGGMGGGMGIGGATGGKGSGAPNPARGYGGLRERSTRTPKLKPGRFQSSGSFNKKIIKRVVRRNKKALTNCYERQLRKKPNLKGRITISWRIGAAGTVGMVKVKNNGMGDSAVASCLVSRIKGWKFPAPSGGGAVDIAYPFNFDSDGGSHSYKQPSRVERIKAYEARTDTLSAGETNDLIELCLAEGQKNKAEKTLDAARERLLKEKTGVLKITSLFGSAARSTFAKKFSDAQHAHFEALVSENDDVFISAALALNELGLIKQRGAWGDVAGRFSKGSYAGGTMYQILTILVKEDQVETGRQLLASLANKKSSREVIQILGRSDGLKKAFQAERFMYSSRMVKENLNDLGVFQQHLALGMELGRGDEVFGLVEARCNDSAMTLVQCRTLIKMIDGPKAEALEQRVIASRIKNMKQIRSNDVGNPELIMEFSALMRSNGQVDAADRLLSEIVEFNPHDYQSRSRYGQALAGLDRPVEACRAYASAVQLNPAQRDTFRSMMSLRRGFEAESKGLRECIVQGVSNLPVTRDVSSVTRPGRRSITRTESRSRAACCTTTSRMAMAPRSTSSAAARRARTSSQWCTTAAADAT